MQQHYKDSYVIIKHYPGLGWKMASPRKFTSIKKAKDFVISIKDPDSNHDQLKVIHSAYFDCLDLFPDPQYTNVDESGKNN